MWIIGTGKIAAAESNINFTNQVLSTANIVPEFATICSMGTQLRSVLDP